MPKFIDISNKKFGMLTAIRVSHRRNGYIYWLWKCDCGRDYIQLPGNVKSGNTRSCGCNRIYSTAEARKTHGMSKSNTYRIWWGILCRCQNENYHAYKQYGGRGIKVCDRWNIFENFLEDMGERPSKELSIDRIDGSGDYEPSNCRWATRTQQQRNVKSNRMITVKGVTKCISEWAEITGIKKGTISTRLRIGWSAEDAITKPINNCGRNVKRCKPST